MYGQHTRLENEILNKILSYHFFVESYTFFCIFCQARPRVSDCVLHAIPTQRHATVTVGPGDEAGIQQDSGNILPGIRPYLGFNFLKLLKLLSFGELWYIMHA